MSSYIDRPRSGTSRSSARSSGPGSSLCYALGMVGASRLAVARERGGASIAAPAVLAAISFAVVAAALVFGLFVMFDK